MDVKLLLNDDNYERPKICRFGPFEPLAAANKIAQHPPHQPQRPHLPAPAQSRTSSYSSDSSSSSSTSSLSPPSSSFSPAHHHSHSRHSFAGSLPSISTRVPPLARSDSGDSDRAHSPLTPSTSPGSTPCLRPEENASGVPNKAVSYIGRTLPRPQILSHASSYSTASSSGPPSSMDPFPAASANGFISDMTFPQTPVQPQPYFNPQAPMGTSPEQQQTAFASNAPTAPKPSQKKNSYPCPLARQFNCSEFFTTSGHAARHAKKHTGKKDAICPECNKAFTRKDNMEQHRRTHSKDVASLPRSASKSQNEKDESRQRKVLKLQQQQNRKSRPPSLSTATSTGSPAANLNNHQITSPSASSAITSPTVDLLPTPSSISNAAPTPLGMDMALDPRLRDGTVSAGPAPSFPQSDFGGSPFAMQNNTLFNSSYPSTQPQHQFQIQAQHQIPQPQPQHHRHSSMNMVSSQPMISPMMSPLGSMPAHSPPTQHISRSPFPNSLDFVPPQPMGLGMTLPVTTGLELGIPGNMAIMMDDTNLAMNQPPLIGAVGDLQSPSLTMAPAMDKLALDKLAMAAEAASNGR